MKIGNIERFNALKKSYEAAGGFWFSPATMSFFDSRVETGIVGNDLFVTSEKEENLPRRYTIRAFINNDVETVADGFQEYKTLKEAVKAAQEVSV